MMTPSFAENVPNITVVAGKDVVLPCIVDNLEHLKVKKIEKIKKKKRKKALNFKYSNLGGVGTSRHSNHFNNSHQGNDFQTSIIFVKRKTKLTHTQK